MNEERSKHLKQRYGFDDWPAADGAGGGGLRLPTSLTGLLPGYSLHRSEPLREEGLPPGLRILWVEGSGAEGTILSAELWQCHSASAARELLLAILDQFQSPLLERLEGARAAGDLAFGHGEHTLVFTLRNLVVQIRNAGRKVIPVAEAAQRLARALEAEARAE
jgi:hypothetical protein